MDEKSFEKKSTKKMWIIIAIILIIAAAIAGGIFFLKGKSNPQSIFSSKIEEAFEMTEKEKGKVKSGRIELDLSANVDTDNAEIKAINPLIKAIKLKGETEFDTDKKLFYQKLVAIYDNDTIMDVDTLLQDEKIYFFLNELFDKYIDFTDLLEEGTELNTLFEESPEIINENLLNEDLLNDIEKIVIDSVKKAELTQEKDEVNGQKVQKTTCHLKEKEIVELSLNIVKKVNEYQKSDDLEDLIVELEDILEDKDALSEKNYIDISLYTKGVNNELVKLTMNIAENKENLGTFEIVKNENKTTVTLTAEDVLLGATIAKEDKTTTVEILVNPEEAKISNAITLLTVTVVKENENEGTIKLTMHLGPIMALEDYEYEDTKLDITLNVKYKVDTNAKIEKRDVSNSVNANDLTDEDLMEILENVQKNEILYSLLSTVAY